jgi:hypothetical protein
VSGADDTAKITDAEQAEAWLRGAVTPSEHRIEFVDSLERMADVRRPGAEATERWEHLFGCWRRTDQPEAPVRVSP